MLRCDAPIGQTGDTVGVRNNFSAVGDQKNRPANLQALDGVGHDLDATRVEIGGGLVEYDERGVPQEGASDCDPAALSGEMMCCPSPTSML